MPEVKGAVTLFPVVNEVLVDGYFFTWQSEVNFWSYGSLS
jgi:hypothetical protein